MNDSTLNQIVMIIYLLSTGLFVWSYTGEEKKRFKPPIIIALIGFSLQLIALVWRWIESYKLGFGHAPLSNRYESLIFFSWCIVGMFLILDRVIDLKRLGAVLMFLAAATIGSTSILPGADAKITPLVPALQSNWLLFHVVTCFFAYSAFAAACFAGIYSLLIFRGTRKKNREHRTLDQVMYRSVVVGFLLLSLGIISGSAWAYNAWGRYWGWDPKEVWSLITWFVYAIYLHARLTRGWSGKKLAILSIIGFLFVLFTFLGVNNLSILKGLHSYA